MAQQRQQVNMKVDLEELVDMFLEDRLGDTFDFERHRRRNDPESIFGKTVSDGTGGRKDPADIFGETVSDSPSQDNVSNVRPQSDLSPMTKEKDRDLAMKHLGRSYAIAGDEYWSSKRESKSNLQVEIAQTGQLTESGQISPIQEEEHWMRFKEMLDKALEDIGPHNPYKMMVAVLVAVRGLSNFGRGVSMLARRFTLRFFEEHRLRADIERVGGIEYLADENLD